jgi:hypothetical protein
MATAGIEVGANVSHSPVTMWSVVVRRFDLMRLLREPVATADAKR